MTLDVEGASHDSRIVAVVVEAAAADLGLTSPQAGHLASAAGAVGRAIHERGFDDPATAAIHVEVARRGHRVVVRLDDRGLPFSYEAEDALDGAAMRLALAGGWLDEIHHEWRGREGNRTVLVRRADPGADLREEGSEVREGGGAVDDVPVTGARTATPDDAPAICRLTWRTYGPTYQHDEYYQPDRLAAMIDGGTQTSFVVTLGSGEVVGHDAVIHDRPDAMVVEGGRAMVDPRWRGHHLLAGGHGLMERWMEEHHVLALTGHAVTAHTRSQRSGPISSVLLGFLPPIRFAGIDATDTALREAVVGGFIPRTPIPPAVVHLPARDREVVARLYEEHGLERRAAPGSSSAPADGRPTRSAVHVHADLGHAVVEVEAIGSDLPRQVADRLRTVRGGGIEVVYVDLPLTDPAVSWAADVIADAGCTFAGILPLQRRGEDLVRYQHLGSTRGDPAASHVKSESGRRLLTYVLDQWEAGR